jgi:protein phosphatase
VTDYEDLDTRIISARASARRSRTDGGVPLHGEFAARSHVGLVRRENQDHFLVMRATRALETVVSNLPEGALPTNAVDTIDAMVVADGMGGAAGGSTASRKAISVLVELVLETPDWIMRPAGLMPEVERRMLERFARVDSAVREAGEQDPQLAGMATTMTLACNWGEELLVAHVGDSRAYLHRDGCLHRITKDHTFAATLAENGVLSDEDVARHPLRHVLTQAIGSPHGSVDVELHVVRLEEGDRLLLCSDGLTHGVPEPAIERAMNDHPEPAEACAELERLALEAGGEDNITVVIGRYERAAAGEAPGPA